MAVLLGTASASVTLDVGQFLGAANQAMGAMDQLGSYEGKGKSSFFSTMTKGALGLGTALIVPMSLGLKAAVDLEQAMANLNASLGGVDGSTLDALSASITDIGAASKFSATEVAAVADELAKAGYGADDLLGGMTQAVIDLSQATGEGLPTATQGITQAMAVWQDSIVGPTLAINDASKAADVLTVAANQSTGGVADVIAGLRPLGPVAASMGVSFEESAAAIAMFTQYGLSGAEAGISLARGLQNLANPTSEASAMMGELGIAAFDMQGNFVGFPALFDQLNTSMADMSDQAQLAALSTIFGAEAIDVMGLAVLQGSSPLEQMIALMQESGAAAEQSALRMDTLGAQFDALKEGANTFLGSLVAGLLPGLRVFVDAGNMLIDMLMKIPGPIKTAIGAVAGLLAGFAAVNTAIAGFSFLAGVLGIGGVGAALSAVLPILLGLAAAAGAVYIAWKTNFLGFKGVIDGIGDAFSGIKGFVDRFLGAFKKVEKPVSAVGKVFDAITGPVDAFKAGFDALTGVVKTVTGPFEAVASAGEKVGSFLDRIAGPANRAAAGFAAVSGAAQGVTDAVSGLGRVFDALGIAISGINGGNIPPWLQDVADFFFAASDAADKFFERFSLARDLALFRGDNPFEAFITGLKSAIGTINVGTIAITIGGWFVAAATSIWDAIVDWWDGSPGDPVLAAAGMESALPVDSVPLRIKGWIVSSAESIWSAIQQWWNGGGGSGDPARDAAGIGGGAQSSPGFTVERLLLNIGEWAMGQVADIGATILDWATEKIGAIDWTGLGNTVRDALTGAISGAFNVGQDIGEAIAGLDTIAINLLDTVTAAITEADWTNIGAVAAQMLINALKAGFGILGTLVSLGPAFITGIIDGISTADWPAVATSIKNFIIAAIEGLSGFALGFGLTLFSELQQALGTVDWGALASTIGTKLGSAISKVSGFAVGLGVTLGSEFLQAVANVDWGGIAGSIKDKLIAGVSEFVGFAADIAIALGSEFLQAIGAIDWGGVAGAVNEKLIANAKGMAAGVWDAIWGFILGDAEGSFIDIDDPLLDPDNQPVNFFGEQFRGKVTAPEVDFSGLDAAKAKLDEFRSASLGVTDNLKAALATPIDTSILTSSLAGLKDAVALSMADLGTSIASGLQSAMQTAVVQVQGIQIGTAFVTGIQQGIAAGSATVGAAVSTLVSTAGNGRIGMTVAGLSVGFAFGDGTASGIRSKSGAVGSAAASYVSTASGYRGAMLAAGLGIGWALGDGVAAGIRSKIGAVAAEASAMVTTAIAAAKAAAAISSPSRVMFDEVGVMLGLGAALGVESQYRRMAEAMTGLIQIPAVRQAQYIPDVPNRSAAASGGGSSYATTTISVDVQAPQGMSDADEADFVQRFAQAIKTGTDLVYMAQGVS